MNGFEDTLIQEDNTNCGNVHASASKREKLLSHKIRITDANYGFNLFVVSLLQPVYVCMTRLKTTYQPLQHRVSRQILKIIGDIKRSFITGNVPEYPERYQRWR